MNDPHVVALHYKIEHAASIDYSNASGFDLHEDVFDVNVENGHVRFSMNDHFATEQAARQVVEDYVWSWRLHTLLKSGPGRFKLRFDRAEIEDRSPTPGVVAVSARPVNVKFKISKAQVTISPSNYPSPPATPLRGNPDVESMRRRYVDFLQNREPLTGTANFCLTVLEAAAGCRLAALQRYGIAKSVLGRVGYLCDSKGGDDARKAKGRKHPLTQQEEQFLIQVVQAMIRRAGELAYNPNMSFKQLTRNDFPKCG